MTPRALRVWGRIQHLFFSEVFRYTPRHLVFKSFGVRAENFKKEVVAGIDTSISLIPGWLGVDIAAVFGMLCSCRGWLVDSVL
jgi:hypothetical protein